MIRECSSDCYFVHSIPSFSFTALLDPEASTVLAPVVALLLKCATPVFDRTSRNNIGYV